jgi:hypothetical protein
MAAARSCRDALALQARPTHDGGHPLSSHAINEKAEIKASEVSILTKKTSTEQF